MKGPLAVIIEDDPQLAEIFSDAVRSVGFQIEIIQDGQLALERLAQIEPELIVLDLHLPTVMGDEILEYVRSDSRLSETQVMIATADAALANELRKISDLVLLKPISVLQLRTLAKRLGVQNNSSDQ